MQNDGQGEAIRAARMARNMTQAHLAVLSGVSEKTVRRIEAGDRVAADSIRSMCAAMGLDAENLRKEPVPAAAPSPPQGDPKGEQAFATAAGAVLLALSCLATMTVLIFDVPAGKVAFAIGCCSVATVLALAVASQTFLSSPTRRRRLMGTPRFQAFLARAESFDNPARFLGCMAATPPAVGVAIHALRGMVEQPSVDNGIVLAFSLVLASVLAAGTLCLLIPDRGNHGQASSPLAAVASSPLIPQVSPEPPEGAGRSLEA